MLSEGSDVGAVIMLGTLFGLIALVFGAVIYFDPEARASKERKRKLLAPTRYSWLYAEGCPFAMNGAWSR